MLEVNTKLEDIEKNTHKPSYNIWFTCVFMVIFFILIISFYFLCKDRELIVLLDNDGVVIENTTLFLYNVLISTITYSMIIPLSVLCGIAAEKIHRKRQKKEKGN